MKNFQVLYMAEDEHDYSGEEEVDEHIDEDAYVVLSFGRPRRGRG